MRPPLTIKGYHGHKSGLIYSVISYSLWDSYLLPCECEFVCVPIVYLNITETPWSGVHVKNALLHSPPAISDLINFPFPLQIVLILIEIITIINLCTTKY